MALAAEIANIDRQRFNEAVAEGFYPCAPTTVKGRARTFGFHDLLALKLYGELLREGVTPRHAGSVACSFLAFLAECPDAERAVHVRGQMGSPSWVRPETFNAASTHISGVGIQSTREWRLENWRDYIIHSLEEAANVVGVKDEGEE